MRDQVIVFGDDGRPQSDRAWLWITSQRWPGWTVDVVTAQHHHDVGLEELPIQLRPWAPSVARTAHPRSELAQVRHLRAFGDPRAVLTSRRDASIMVVGPRRAHGQARAMFSGGTTNHLLRTPPAPLVIANTPNPASRVLVCTDGSRTAQHAVEIFAALPFAEDAEVHVIGVDRSGTLGRQNHDQDDIDAGVARAVEALGPLAPHPIHVAASDADIAEHANALRAELLVLGTRGRTGLTRLLLGSTFHALTRATTCALLVVPTVPSRDRSFGPPQEPPA